ncbi:MAG: thermosome subunit alpha [Nanoarchaeota archaeon]|mgnify:FL=1
MAPQDSVVSDSVSRTLGREAQRNNILAARVVADILKTTLGPKGMDKMLVDSAGTMTITNDGATILEEMQFDHPAAKLIVEIAKTQEREVGDGTTSVALLAGVLLEHAEKLLDRRIHPTAIIKGYRTAALHAQKILEEVAFSARTPEALRTIAMTAMTGKGAEGNRAHFADLIVQAVTQVAEGTTFDMNAIKIVKTRGERVEQSQLIQGMVLEKEIAHADMPRSVRDARVALVDVALEMRSPETETSISISSPEQLRGFLDSEERYLREMTEQLISTGARVLFCQKGIDDVVQYYLAQAGVMAFRRVPRSDMERLAKATGGKIVSTIHELRADYLGYAGEVNEIVKGDDSLVYVQQCKNPKAVTLLVYGTSDHFLDEVERAVRDGLGVVASAVRSGKAVSGGGAVEIEVARRLRGIARTLTGREQLAMEEFASVLETIPATLAENAGLDPIEVVAELRRRHEAGNVHEGLNLLKDSIENCYEAGIVEPLQVKQQAISAATEVATMILRIDDVLISSDKPRTNAPSDAIE